MGVLITREAYVGGHRNGEVSVGLVDGDYWETDGEGSLFVYDDCGQCIGEFRQYQWNTVVKAVSPQEIAAAAVDYLVGLLEDIAVEEYLADEAAAYAEKAEREAYAEAAQRLDDAVAAYEKDENL